MSIDPDTFREMFEAHESQNSDDFKLSDEFQLSDEFFDEPPVRSESGHVEEESHDAGEIEPPIRSALIEPPIRAEEPPIRIAEPPPSLQEIESAAADELAKIAAEDEKDLKNVQKAMRSKDTFVIYCPKGCKIRVKEQHRGRSGKCPRCKSNFVIPKK